MEMTEDSMTLGDQLSTEETPETLLLVKEGFTGHRAAFNALAEADRELLLAYLSAGCNARKLARRLNKDPSGVTKRLKRAAHRLKENIEKNF